MRRSDRYRQVIEDLEYHCRGISGQYDILGIIDEKHARYVEVKSTDHDRAYAKARHQFDRAKAAYPGIEWEFEYVTPERRHLVGAQDRPERVRRPQGYVSIESMQEIERRHDIRGSALFCGYIRQPFTILEQSDGVCLGGLCAIDDEFCERTIEDGSCGHATDNCPTYRILCNRK
jgi:hypothetical protein